MLDILGESALRSFILALVVQCVVWLLRLRQPRLLLATWTVVLMASIAMPVLPHLVPLRVPLAPAFPEPVIEAAMDLLQQSPPQAPSGSASAALQTRSSPWPWLEAVHLAVACGMLFRVLLGVGLSLRLMARAVPVWPDWAAGRRVRISQDVTGPVTIAHIILLPTDAMAWPSEMQQAVLAHEQAHAARWDYALLVVSQLNRALFWFSPLPWWLHRRLVTLTELASDDQAIAATRDRLGYAEVLLEMGRRSGPAFRGPAMARPSTLASRIDRILLDQATAHHVSRAQQALLVAGMAGLSLGIASLAHGPASDFVAIPSATRRDARSERPMSMTVASPGQESTSRQVASTTSDGPPAMSAAGVQIRMEAPPQPVPPSAPAASLAGGPAGKPVRPVLPAPHPVLRAASNTPPALSPPRAMDRSSPVTAPMAAVKAWSGQAASPQLRDIKQTSQPGIASAGGPATANADRPSLAPELASDLPPLQSGLDGIAGSICTGTVAVGLRASGSVPGRPNVVPGQAVPAQAHFFRKDTGTLWVRFNAFGRPPLDVPVRFVRNGMTWTGEYGIAYTVQAAGGNRLAGLAALVANDSAKLDFGCSRSASHIL